MGITFSTSREKDLEKGQADYFSKPFNWETEGALFTATQNGDNLILDETNTLRPAGFWERVKSKIHFKKNGIEEKLNRKWIITLFQLKDAKNYQGTLKAAEAFYKHHKHARGSKQLANAIFATKCVKALHLNVTDLIDKNGAPSQQHGQRGPHSISLIDFIRKNHLHKVMPKANPEEIDLNIVEVPRNDSKTGRKDIYVRVDPSSVLFNPLNMGISGNLLLDKEALDHLIEKMEKKAQNLSRKVDHKDYKALKALQNYSESGWERDSKTVSKKKQANENDRIPLIIEKCKKLGLTHYIYVRLGDIPLTKRGQMIGMQYLAHGLKNHQDRDWKYLVPAYIEPYDASSHNEKNEEEKPLAYELRVVSHLPSYITEKNLLKKVYLFVTNFFRFTKHGHSYIELVKPIEVKTSSKKSKNAPTHAEVFAPGFYTPFNKHLQNPDHRLYLQEKTNVERYSITKEQYDKAIRYIETLKWLEKASNKEIKEFVEGKVITSLSNRAKVSQLTEDQQEREDILALFISIYTLSGGTCLTFASEIRNLITDQNYHYRDSLRTFICPDSYLKPLQSMLVGFVKTPLIPSFIKKPISLVLSLLYFINHAELPGRTTNKPNLQPISKKSPRDKDATISEALLGITARISSLLLFSALAITGSLLAISRVRRLRVSE